MSNSNGPAYTKTQLIRRAINTISNEMYDEDYSNIRKILSHVPEEVLVKYVMEEGIGLGDLDYDEGEFE